MKSLKRTVLLYFVFILLFSTVVWLFTIHATHQGLLAGRIYGYAIMWCPALAVYFSFRLTGRSFSDLSWNWPKTKYLFRAYLIPLLYALIAYLIIWSAGWGEFYKKEFIHKAAEELGWQSLPDAVFIGVFIIVYGLITLIPSMGAALGEEIGWRGFLVPALYNNMRFSYTSTSLITGLIWAVWHYPLLIFSDYNNGTAFWYGLLCFTVAVVAASFYIYLVQAEKWKPVARRHITRQSQSVYTGDIYTDD